MDVSNKDMKNEYDYLVTKSEISISFLMKVNKMCGHTCVVCDQTINVHVHSHRTHVIEVFLNAHSHTHDRTSNVCMQAPTFATHPLKNMQLKYNINLIYRIVASSEAGY